MKRVVVTGAAGFLGTAVQAALAARDVDLSVRAIDRVVPAVPDARFEAIAADLAIPMALADLIGETEVVVHLAVLPGGASENDPEASRRVNLDLPLALIDHLGRSPGRPQLVLASSIAVFGAPLPDRIDDDTLPLPVLTYGTHKLMSEAALADAARSRASPLRLPGLVARPGVGTGLRSAFMSGIFHAAVEGRGYTLPVSPDATVWIMSAGVAADNMVRAALDPHPCGERVAMTLPALRTTVSDLVDRILAQTGSAGEIRYAPDAMLQAQFATLPPLSADLARASGYRDDGSLVATVLADLRDRSPRS